MTNETKESLREELWVEVMEDYVITAELGHLAKGEKKHKEEMRQHFDKLITFIDQALKSQREEIFKDMKEKMYHWHGSGQAMLEDYQSKINNYDKRPKSQMFICNLP